MDSSLTRLYDKINHMDTNDAIQPQVTKVQLFVYEGDIVKDEDGNITNALRETIEYDIDDEAQNESKNEEIKT